MPGATWVAGRRAAFVGCRGREPSVQGMLGEEGEGASVAFVGCNGID